MKEAKTPFEMMNFPTRTSDIGPLRHLVQRNQMSAFRVRVEVAAGCVKRPK